MALKASFKKHILKFKFDAGTSRGVLHEKNTWYIKIWDDQHPEVFGIGEAGPLVKLSIDDVPEFEDVLSKVIYSISDCKVPSHEADVHQLVQEVVSSMFPSIQF